MAGSNNCAAQSRRIGGAGAWAAGSGHILILLIYSEARVSRSRRDEGDDQLAISRAGHGWMAVAVLEWATRAL
jgi:hypothetical protein